MKREKIRVSKEVLNCMNKEVEASDWRNVQETPKLDVIVVWWDYLLFIGLVLWENEDTYHMFHVVSHFLFHTN
ncbi:hypothetical protein Lal_00032479 [Lupinus albus]|nr:hypothetical protein Lal_00032479 [Lupinus albus]